jgi:hypothetical protein
MLYLIENPVVREAFFPSTAHLHVVGPADASHWQDIRGIIARHESPESAAILDVWWEAYPEAFRVIRDRNGGVAGVSVVANAARIPARIAQRDPVVAAWRDHLARHPLPRGQQQVLFDRRCLDREAGEAPSEVQAAAWLDVKRRYMEMRPTLGRLYTTVVDPTPYLDALITLGFAPFPAPIDVGDVSFHCANLDFGEGSVDGWLSRLAAAELGVTEDDLLDETNRAVVLDGERIDLTQLEFGVMRHLARREGSAATRIELIEAVWGHTYTEGSNVVDVVVRSLRRKLGKHASMIETVRGVGYRFRRP